MKRFHGNTTTASFPRASSDNPLRSPEVFSGPHRRAPSALVAAVSAVLWAAGVAALVALAYAPALWRWFAA